ncbi:uncharacterized protein [Hemitrygon akajei]|uniref:uncharacterized protein n=1 Tax=Hemitrygon akajei TaxID=2704970 RepID=UPI003BF9DF45
METVSRQRELGQESVQLRALNERLECYLQRVAVLEKENSTLRDHIQALKPGPDGGRRKELEAELEALRQELTEGLRETDRAALQRDTLLEEVRLVAERCCGEARLRTSAEKELAERRRWLEEEQRGRKGLEGKVRMFQDELGHLEEVQREERNVLLQETARNSLRCPTAPVAAISPPDLRLCLGEVDLKWTEARDLYRDELTRLERVVSEAGLRQEAAREETRLNRHRLQGLRGELEALREKRRQLEERLRQQNRASEQDTQRLQATVGELERERETLAAKMEQIVEEQRQLMQMKLALSLEVATYRALLDTEAQRIHSSAGARGLPASLRDAQLGFPGGKGLSTEKHSAPVRLEAGNAWRSAHPGAVTVPSGWKERKAFTDAAPTRTEPSAGRAAGRTGNGSVATWPGEFPAERDLVDGESAQDVPLDGGARDEADKCPADDRSSETPDQENTETKLFTKPAAHPPLTGLLNGDIAEPGADGGRPHLSPPLSTCPESAPEHSGHPNIGAEQFNGELRDPVEGDSDSDSLREVPDSVACQSGDFGEVTERPVEVALSRQGTSEARPGKETGSGSGEGRWSEEAIAFIKEEDLVKEEGTSVEDQCLTAANVPWEDSAREARPEKLETRRLSVEMERIREQDDKEVERIREQDDEEMTAESLLHGGENAPNTHETNDPVGRGSGDGAVETGAVGESEAGYPEGSGTEEGQLSESFQEPEVEVARIEESQTDKKVCAIPAHEDLSSGEELSAVMEEAVLMENPAAEDGVSEGWSPEMPGESIQQHPAEGSPEVKGEEVFGKEEEDHPEPPTEGMEAEPRSEAVDAPLRWEEMAEVKVDSEGRFCLETDPTREEQEVEEKAPTSLSAEEPADYLQEDRDGKPRENPEELLTVVTPVEKQFEAASEPWTQRMEAEFRSEEMDASLRWEEPVEDRMDSEERASPEKVCSREEQTVEKRVPTAMGTDDPTRHPQGDGDDEPRENESLSFGPRAEERSIEGMETESRPEAMDVPLRLDETAEKRVDSEGRASPVRVTTREEQEKEERVPTPVCAEEPADHPQGDQDDESQEDPLCLRPRAEEEVVEQHPEAIDAPLQSEKTAEARLDMEGRASPETLTTCEEPEAEVSVPTLVCAGETADHTEGDRDGKPREDAVESPRLGSRVEEEQEVEPTPELWTERLETEHRPEAMDAPFEWEETAEMRVDSEGRASPERVPACEEVEVEVRVPTPVCAEQPEDHQQRDRDGEPQEKPEVSLGFGPRREDQEEEAVPGPSTEGMDWPQSDAALRWEETAEVKVVSDGRASYEWVTISEEAEVEVRIPTPECANEPADHLQGDRDGEPREGPEESLNPESTAHEEIRAAPEPWTVGLEAESLPEEVGMPLPAEERMEGRVIPDRITPDEEQAVEKRALMPVCTKEIPEERLEGRVITDSAKPDEEQAVEKRALTPECAVEPAEERLEVRAIPDRVTPNEEQATEQRVLTPVCVEEPTEERLKEMAVPDSVTPDEAQAVEQRVLTLTCAEEPKEEQLEGRAVPDRVTPDEEQATEQRVLTPVCVEEPTEERLKEMAVPDSVTPDEAQAVEQRVQTLTCAEEPKEERLEGRAVPDRVTPDEEQATEQRVLTPVCVEEPTEERLKEMAVPDSVTPDEAQATEQRVQTLTCAEEPKEERLEGRAVPDRVTPDEEQATEQRVLTLTCAEEPMEERLEGRVITDSANPDEEQAVEKRALTPVCAVEPAEERLKEMAIPDSVTPDEAQAVEQRVQTLTCAEEPKEERLEGRAVPDRVTPDEEQAVEQRVQTPVCVEKPTEERLEEMAVPDRVTPDEEQAVEQRVKTLTCAEEPAEERLEEMAVPDSVTPDEAQAAEQRALTPVCTDEPADHLQGDRESEPQENSEVSPDLGPRAREELEEPRPEAMDVPFQWEETAEARVDSEGRASPERVHEELEAEVSVPEPVCVEEPADHPQGDRDGEPQEKPEVSLGLGPRREDQEVETVPGPSTEGKEILRSEVADAPLRWDETAEVKVDSEERDSYERGTTSEEPEVDKKVQTSVDEEETADYPQGDRDSEPREGPEELPTLESTADEVILAAPEPWTMGTKAESRPEEVDVPLPAEERMEGRAIPDRDTADVEKAVEQTALTPVCTEERMEGRTIVDIVSPDEEQAVQQRALTPICAEEPANHPQGYREGEPRENPEDLVTPEFPAKEEEVPGAPGLNFSEEAGTVPGDDGERKEWAGEFVDEAAQVPEHRSIQMDAGHVQEEDAELKTAAVGEEESIGAKDTGFSEANLETGDQETVIRKDKSDLEVAEGELERGSADQAEIPGEVSEPETEARGAEIEDELAIQLRASFSADEDSPQVKSISLAEMELAEDEDTFRVEEVGAGEEVTLASAELTEPREEMSATASALPDGPEEKGISTSPAALSLDEKPTAQEDQALRDSPEGAEDRALPPSSLSNILPETPGSEDQSLAEWQEDVAQACALPSQGTDVQEDSIPWEERPGGCQLIEGFPKESPSAGAEVESQGQASYVSPDVDAEGSPTGRLTLEDSMGVDGLETEEAGNVENVDNFQDAAIPNCPGDPTRIQPAKGEKSATAAEQNASTGFQTPGILLPDQTEIQVAVNPEFQRVDSDRLEVADQERPQGKEEAEDQHAPILESAAERPGLEQDAGCPLEEREKVTLRIEADESDSGHGVAAGSGEGGIPVKEEGQPTEPQPMNEVWEPASFPETLSHPEDLEDEALAGEEPLVNRPGKGKDEGDGGSVDLLLIPKEASPSRDLFLAPQSTSSAQDTWTAQNQEPRPDTPLVTNDRHLNGVHDYSEVPAKSDGRAVEMIATAYHYWSSEDE